MKVWCCEQSLSQLEGTRSAERQSLHAAGHGAIRESGTRSRRHVLSWPILLPAMSGTLVRPAPTLAASDSFDEDNAVRQAYNRYADEYDWLNNGAARFFGFPEQRQQLLSRASGDVLEIAVGTGLNLEYYNTRTLTSLTALDLSAMMLAKAQERLSALPVLQSLTTVQEGNAQALPFPSGSFDCVVDTFSLCVFPRPDAALSEIARVLRRGGHALLLEHARAPGVLGWYQDATAIPVATLGKGCIYNQRVRELIEHAGLTPILYKRYLGGTVVMVEAMHTGV